MQTLVHEITHNIHDALNKDMPDNSLAYQTIAEGFADFLPSLYLSKSFQLDKSCPFLSRDVDTFVTKEDFERAYLLRNVMLKHLDNPEFSKLCQSTAEGYHRFLSNGLDFLSDVLRAHFDLQGMKLPEWSEIKNLANELDADNVKNIIVRAFETLNQRIPDEEKLAMFSKEVEEAFVNGSALDRLLLGYYVVAREAGIFNKPVSVIIEVIEEIKRDLDRPDGYSISPVMTQPLWLATKSSFDKKTVERVALRFFAAENIYSSDDVDFLSQLDAALHAIVENAEDEDAQLAVFLKDEYTKRGF